MPYYYLLYTFWALELVPVLVSLSVDIVTVALPFALLRPVHAHTSATGNKTANQAIALDWQVSLLTAGLAACLYSTIWYFTYLFSDLSVFLITHFESIPTLERLHASTIPALLQLFAGNGVAAMLFMFRPAMAASGPPKTVTRRRSGSKKFKAETATLAETLTYNIWGEAGPSHRGEVLAKRAGVLMLMTMVNTFIRVFGTVDGTDVVGSLGYAALWTSAQGIVAVGYSILGQE